MARCRPWLLLILLLALVPSSASAGEDANEETAAKLTRSTATVRILPARGMLANNGRQAYAAQNNIGQQGNATNNGATNNTAPGNTAPAPAQGGQPPVGQPTTSNNTGSYSNGNNDNFDAADGVTICSGVSVAKGLIVTCGLPLARQLPSTARFRVTLPDGEQTKATLRVVDHYSSLSLLEIEEQDVPVLEMAEGPVNVGSAVMTAAGAGIERPVVSLGIVGGVDRAIAGNEFPPLLQCDVRTTDTSSGAAIVNRQGKLLGIVVATSLPSQQAGWTYAVPARHISRIIQAFASGKLVVLERQRPSVGCTMGAGAKEGSVEVEHIVPGGPADKAGIKEGDRVLEAEGHKIRSAYQAVDLLLNRQPGENFNFVVERDNERKSFDVKLGGGEVRRQAGGNESGQNGYATPQVQVRVNDRNKIEVRNSTGVAELDAFQLPRRDAQPQQRGAVDEATLLRGQLGAFDKVIVQLKQELTRREALDAKNASEVEQLRQEVQELRKQLGNGNVKRK